jgi:predicted aconitase
MDLTPEEKDILNGKQGKTLAKVMQTVITYGELFGAKKLVALDNPVHLVTSFGVTMLKPIYKIMDELIDSGLKTKLPFTVDPRPMDHKNMGDSLLEKLVFKIVYGKQKPYEKQLKYVGIKNDNAYTCTCYMEEVGNIPDKGDIIAWAESSAVIYANSVLGARSNRNSAIIDLFCGILGKTPEFGFLTDEGRMANWIIELNTPTLPPAQVLGSSIGMKVREDVPYIKGLDKLFEGLNEYQRRDYMKDMGAAAASNGAVGLFHVENITPEAKEKGTKLIKENSTTYRINDKEIIKVKDSYPVLWKNPEAKPDICFIGCPHLSLKQLEEWTHSMKEILKQKSRKKMSVKTIFSAAPDVVEKFKTNRDVFSMFVATGARLTSTCALMAMSNPLYQKKNVITNSNKLRIYTTGRYYNDNEILEIIC